MGVCLFAVKGMEESQCSRRVLKETRCVVVVVVVVQHFYLKHFNS